MASISLCSSSSALVLRRLDPILRRAAEEPFCVETALEARMTARIAGSIYTFMSRFSAMLSLRKLTQLLIQLVNTSPMTVLQTLRIHYNDRKRIKTTLRYSSPDESWISSSESHLPTWATPVCPYPLESTPVPQHCPKQTGRSSRRSGSRSEGQRCAKHPCSLRPSSSWTLSPS